MNKRTLSLRIKQEALKLGFDDCGIAEAERLEPESGFLKTWLQHGYHAEMNYMTMNQEKRTNPVKLMEGAKSVICLLSNYKPKQWQHPDLPQIAAYAYGPDYHFVLKERLHLLKIYINSHTNATMRLFTDTAPILERAWAVRAGLGWSGKNSLLISPRFGPYTFISVVLIATELAYDTPIDARCGSCTHCIDACPTGALCLPYTLDARRCLSYLTIESKTPCTLDPGSYIFGCDGCIRACPWGAQAPPTTLFRPLPGILQNSAKDWETMSPDDFKQHFAGSALQRAGLSKIQHTLTLWNGKPK
ncbi:MAG: tRNA epoxyqueuosine(34) reductase QueG [Bacteroidetes bacterium]|nr:tRNA epoxyqueuosine(34) reductase QueG [Bacteroidota bacterium]